jgi:hypothetical protein
VRACCPLYPGGTAGSDRSWDGLFHPFPSIPATTAFPKTEMGRLPRRKFRGLLGSSLALRPARSRDRRAVLCIEGFDGFVASTAAPIATGWSEPVAGRELHPLKIRAFSRRTPSPLFSVGYALGSYVKVPENWDPGARPVEASADVTVPAY